MKIVSRAREIRWLGVAAAAVILACGAFLSTGPALAARTVQSFPLGKWQMNANGRVRSMDITAVHPDGTLVGRMQNSTTITGHWDERARKITFTRIINPDRKDTVQQYTGYLLDANPEARDGSFRIAGTFTFRGPGSSPSRQVYGWYATLPR